MGIRHCFYFWAMSGAFLCGASAGVRDPGRLAGRPSPTPGPSGLPKSGEPTYDEQGIRAKRTSLESKGMELYRSPAGQYTFNVGVHSLFVYSVTQCLPLEKDLEVRLALKHAMSQHKPDGQEVLTAAPGAAYTAGTLSVFFAF